MTVSMPRRRKRSVLVLGSTGSIGRSALAVIRAHPDLFTVAALAARGTVDSFVQQVREFRPRAATLLDPAAAAEARRALRGTRTDVRAGAEGILSLFEDPGADAALVGVAGAEGLSSTVEAVRRGMRVALANKESLVVAGPQLLREARRTGASILPVDSEHCAVAQALLAGRREEVRRILLTASGGALRDLPLEQLRDARPEDALHHPTWKMGRRITVDSATLMNKALEVVEAVHLFGVPPERVEVLLHRQSVVHSMVEFRDGSVIAQMGKPDMRLPILWALSHPDRPDVPEFRLDLAEIARLDFAAPDPARYPALALGWRAAREGGVSGAVLNAADERAVELFLEGRVRFTDIAPLVAAAMDGVPPGPSPRGERLETFLRRARAADAAARRAVDARAAGSPGRLAS
jgi:1-deoxy-D-xylulose-5-phosphate reductoisomerase